MSAESISYMLYIHDHAEEKEVGGPQEDWEIRNTLGSGAFAVVKEAVHKVCFCMLSPNPNAQDISLIFRLPDS